VDRFYWGSYRKDRVDWSSLPPEGASLLRAGFVIAPVLCVSCWSVALLMLALAAGRALLLAGAAVANRPWLRFVALLDLYVGFELATCWASKTSWTGLLVAPAVLWAVAGSESVLSRSSKPYRAAALLALVAGGAASAVCGMILPPFKGKGPVKLVVGGAAFRLPAAGALAAVPHIPPSRIHLGARASTREAALDPALLRQSSGQGGSTPSNPSSGGPRASCLGGSGSAPTTQPGIGEQLGRDRQVQVRQEARDHPVLGDHGDGSKPPGLEKPEALLEQTPIARRT
jgi:hypothetical protein